MKRAISKRLFKGVTFRLLEARDLPLTLSWRNSPEIRRWFKNQKEITMNEHVEWFASYEIKNDDYTFIAEIDGNIIGQLAVYNISSDNGMAEVGRFISAPNVKGKGIMTRVIKCFLAFVSYELSIKEVYLEVYKDNDIAIRVYNKLGFEINGESGNLIKMRLCNCA